MPYTTYPVWAFPPNWGGGVLERLEWKTDVMTSELSYEQRVPRRLTPRRSFEASFLLHKENRQYFDVLMTTKAASIWLIPIWHDVTQILADAATGSNILFLDTRWREYAVGEKIIIRGAKPWTYEVATIQSMTDSSLQLISNLENDWGRGTFIYPAKLARLNFNISLKKDTDQLFDGAVTFNMYGTNPFSSNLTLSQYRGTAILETRPNDSEDLKMDYLRVFSTLDNEYGVPDIYDFQDRGGNLMAYKWGFAGREQHYKLRQLFYYLHGRGRSIWVPSFMQDFTPVVDMASADTTITVSNVGYTRLNARVEGRQDICIELVGGYKLYRRITGSAEVDAFRETLTLDAAIGQNITVDSINAISYISRCRLDTDSVELNHPTDSDGVTESAVVWRGPMLFETNPSITGVWPALPTLVNCDCGTPGYGEAKYRELVIGPWGFCPASLQTPPRHKLAPCDEGDTAITEYRFGTTYIGTSFSAAIAALQASYPYATTYVGFYTCLNSILSAFGDPHTELQDARYVYLGFNFEVGRVLNDGEPDPTMGDWSYYWPFGNCVQPGAGPLMARSFPAAFGINVQSHFGVARSFSGLDGGIDMYPYNSQTAARTAANVVVPLGGSVGGAVCGAAEGVFTAVVVLHNLFIRAERIPSPPKGYSKTTGGFKQLQISNPTDTSYVWRPAGPVLESTNIDANNSVFWAQAAANLQAQGYPPNAYPTGLGTSTYPSDVTEVAISNGFV